jgi:hypothetical protein
VGVRDINTNYHKSINKTLISRNYFDALQKRLLLCDNHLEHTGFAIGTLKDFGKCVANAWNILQVINKIYPQYSCGYVKPSMAIGTRCEPLDRDRSDGH